MSPESVGGGQQAQAKVVVQIQRQSAKPGRASIADEV